MVVTLIVLSFIAFVSGYSTCYIITASKIAEIKEEANEYIEYMRKTFEERYNKDD